MVAPFLYGFALRISDSNADLPQHLLVNLADRCSERPDSCRGIEIKDCHKIFMVKVSFRFQSTPGHQCISDTDGGCCLELYSDVKLIIFLQKGTVNDIEKVLPILCPVFFCQLSGNIRKLLGKIISSDIVSAFQHSCHSVHVSIFQLPQPRGSGMFTSASVRNIKHIAQAWPVT